MTFKSFSPFFAIHSSLFAFMNLTLIYLMYIITASVSTIGLFDCETVSTVWCGGVFFILIHTAQKTNSNHKYNKKGWRCNITRKTIQGVKKSKKSIYVCHLRTYVEPIILMFKTSLITVLTFATLFSVKIFLSWVIVMLRFKFVEAKQGSVYVFKYTILRFILQSVHLLYKYAIRINFCFIRTIRINFLTRRINFPAYE